jgi:hypothetical protein
MREKCKTRETHFVPVVNIAWMPGFLRRRLGLVDDQYYKLERRVTFGDGQVRVRRNRGWLGERQRARVERFKGKYQREDWEASAGFIEDVLYSTNLIMRVDSFWSEE